MTNLFKLLSILFLFAQCSKEKTTEQTQNTPPLTLEEKILGKWDWYYSQYPFNSDSVLASPDSVQKTLNFKQNDSVYEEIFFKGTLVPSASTVRHYEVIMHFDGMDSIPAIVLDKIRYGFNIYSDLLWIDMSRNDQGSHWYTRN